MFQVLQITQTVIKTLPDNPIKFNSRNSLNSEIVARSSHLATSYAILNNFSPNITKHYLYRQDVLTSSNKKALSWANAFTFIPLTNFKSIIVEHVNVGAALQLFNSQALPLQLDLQ